MKIRERAYVGWSEKATVDEVYNHLENLFMLRKLFCVVLYNTGLCTK